MKIYVEAAHDSRHRLTTMLVKDGRVSLRAYRAAAKRIEMIGGDYLRIAQAGSPHKEFEIIVMDGSREWGIVH